MTRLDALVALQEAVKDGDFWNEAQYEVFGNGTDEVTQFQSALKGSIDAALALLAAVLPEWTWGVGVNAYHSYATASVRKLSEAGDRIAGDFSETAPNPARALLLAIIAALIEGERNAG